MVWELSRGGGLRCLLGVRGRCRFYASAGGVSRRQHAALHANTSPAALERATRCRLPAALQHVCGQQVGREEGPGACGG